jgi:nicotinamide-nucleotide amidase
VALSAPLSARICQLNVELITIGDELLLGFTIDTNAAWLARELASFGVAVTRKSTCGDNIQEIVDTIRAALDRTGAVITTGGLGPTADDLTNESVAKLFDAEMELDQTVLDHLKALWTSRKRPGELPQANYKQAMIPRGAQVLKNNYGTAPGIFIEDKSGRWVATLPGVPSEMRGMFTESLRPILTERGSDRAKVIKSRTLRTVGVPESMLAERLSDLGQGFGGLSLAYLPHVDGVDIRLTSRDLPADEAEHALQMGANELYNRLDDIIYGEGDTELASLVLEMCRKGNLRLAVAESCTGGMLGGQITRIAGASDIFHGGLISYDNRVKRQLLGVLDSDIQEHGAVSEPVARQMAKGIRIRLGTEIGLSITGIAGPGGGTPEKPVGTVWIGIDVAEGRPPIPRPDGLPPITPFQEARLFHMVGSRDEIRQRSVQAALEFLRRSIASLIPSHT